MNMIEKVARAMCTTHWPTEDRWNVYQAAAKAAIKAMREPSEEMIFKLLNYEIEESHPAYQMTKNNYQAMIDAALKE